MFSPDSTRRGAAFLLSLSLLSGPSTAATKPAAAATKPAAASEAPAVPSQQGRCGDGEGNGSNNGGSGNGALTPQQQRDAELLETSTVDPRTQLQQLVQMALERSRTIGAVRLLTMAAEADYEEAKAQRQPTVSVNGTAGHVGGILEGVTTARGLQARGALNVTAPLYDSGRIAKLTEWRKQLADAARFGQSSAEEQLALQTVSLALDRGRYQLQAQVYNQYTRKMVCLVESLEIITKADRGRASELVQAQKTLQQTDLSYAQTISALRQTEVRLKRFVGDQLPRAAGMSAVLAQLPDVNEMQADVLLAADVAQAAAQAKAQFSYAESVKAGQGPSVSVLANGSSSTGQTRQSDWFGGVSVNIPIVTPGADAAVTSALRRAQAANMQRDEAIEAKRYRVLEMHEAASSALDRARRVVDILRNSDRVRASTLQQWQQLGRRSLFDVMASESDYYSMRIAHVNALFDAEQVVAIIWSQGRGVMAPLR